MSARQRGGSRAVAVARRELRAARGDDALSRVSGRGSLVRERGGAGVARARGDGRRRGRASAPRARGGGARTEQRARGAVCGESPSGAWRAVAARGTGSSERATLRRAFYVDPDERVRREALHSALEAQDPADLTVLLETARLDPDPMSRSIATRAVGMIGGAQASLGLEDLWPGADEAEELAIVEAWSMPRPSIRRAVPTRSSASRKRVGRFRPSWRRARWLRRLAAPGAKGGRRRAHGYRKARHDGRAARRSATPPARLRGYRHRPGRSRQSGRFAAVRVTALARLLDVPARRAAALAAARNDGAEPTTARRVRLGSPSPRLPIARWFRSSSGISRRMGRRPGHVPRWLCFGSANLRKWPVRLPMPTRTSE